MLSKFTIIRNTLSIILGFFIIMGMNNSINALEGSDLEEKEYDLGISAGLQDRVIQAYDQPVYMDFERGHMESKGYGIYSLVDPDLFPDFYIAYQANLTHKDKIHNDVRKRFERGDIDIIRAMEKIGNNVSVSRLSLSPPAREPQILHKTRHLQTFHYSHL